jgi:hypothetical protein
MLQEKESESVNGCYPEAACTGISSREDVTAVFFVSFTGERDDVIWIETIVISYRAGNGK